MRLERLHDGLNAYTSCFGREAAAWCGLRQEIGREHCIGCLGAGSGAQALEHFTVPQPPHHARKHGQQHIRACLRCEEQKYQAHESLIRSTEVDGMF
jgi:hypothetical protein